MISDADFSDDRREQSETHSAHTRAQAQAHNEHIMFGSHNWLSLGQLPFIQHTQRTASTNDAVSVFCVPRLVLLLLLLLFVLELVFMFQQDGVRLSTKVARYYVKCK